MLKMKSQNRIYLFTWMLTFLTSFAAKTDGEDSMVEVLTTGFVPDEWEPVTHRTSLGVIEGRIEKAVGRERIVENYYAFRGIPYARAPVGDLRYADTIDAPEPWPESYFDATKYGSVCPQFDNQTRQVVGKEDCLFLNIFTPTLPVESSEVVGGLPVFVFIHGGGYIRGSGSGHHGGRLAGQNIVVVTLNYRLGVLGFLSTGDSIIPGNFGVLDQLSALRWVQRNIVDFGGDPTKVTVGGFSVGSAFSQLHTLSPLSKGLLRSTIQLSGSVYCLWSFDKSPKDSIESFVEKLDCPKDSQGLKTCLADKTTDQIIRAQNGVMRYEFWPLPIRLVLDAGNRKEPVLPAPPSELEPYALPALVGQVPQEGLVFASNALKVCGHPGDAKTSYEELVRYTVSSVWQDKEDAEKVAEAVETYYYTESAKRSLNTLFEELSETINDYFFHVCISDGAMRIAKAGSAVYMFLFAHRGEAEPVRSLPVYKMARSVGVTSSSLTTGVTHGDNLPFLFSTGEYACDEDEEVAHFFATNVANFVSKGSPAISESEWPTLNPGGPVLFYEISNNPHMQADPHRAREFNFWLQTLPFILKLEEVLPDGLDLSPWLVGFAVICIAMNLFNRNQRVV